MTTRPYTYENDEFHMQADAPNCDCDYHFARAVFDDPNDLPYVIAESSKQLDAAEAICPCQPAN
ncbi:hypothetical protein Ep4_021 [Pseudomonas phage Ep4]|uniref:Uncharacterized protein n=1 Tax=Pseudomonas phage Ep4 TaxID=3057492 RepID=A0AAU9E6U0_9CAUD|nr:hypothetical protein Ep4_021 [Pseudomonas phage Ep4]